jgi:hypothetical protein
MLACKLNDLTDELLDVCWQSSNSYEMPAKTINGISVACQKWFPRRFQLVPEKDSAASPKSAGKNHPRHR